MEHPDFTKQTQVEHTLHGRYLGNRDRYLIFHQANATGRSGKTVREYLEKAYTEELAANSQQVVKLAVKALLEVIEVLFVSNMKRLLNLVLQRIWKLLFLEEMKNFNS